MPSQDFGPSTQQFDAAQARDALPAGTRLGGYQIVEMIERSRFGIAYLALDSSLQRQLTIKEYLPADLAMRSEGPQVVLKSATGAEAFANGMVAFLAEAKLLSRLDHPSLTHVHSFWEENGTAYMVMPYHDGQTLAATLAALPQPPDEAWLRALLTPILSALNVLHSAQCHHRDISPDNIFIRADGRPMLLDLGASSHVLGDKTLPPNARLNPAYAPIEQYGGSATLPQGPWSDLYALAGVLRFAITGRTPAPATLRATTDTQRPLAQTPGLPYSAGFLSAIDKALALQPRDRPRDVGDFQKWLDQVPAPTPPTPPAPASSTRTEPVFNLPPVREEWFAADTGSAPAAPRRHGPLWVAGLCVVALAALGGWWWTQMLPVPAAPAIVQAALPPASAVVQTPSAASAPTEVPASAAMPEQPASQPESSASAIAPAMAASEASVAIAPAEPASVAAAASAVVAEQPAPEPVPGNKVAKAAPVAVEADNPRAVCGPRTNFSLYYCMQTQCKRSRFAQHPQCIELRRRGE